MALGNAYQCRIVVHECTETNTWTNDLRNNKTQYEKVLYFAKTEPSHLDLVVVSKKYETLIYLQNLWIQKLK